MPRDARRTLSRSQHEIPVTVPYRLDLTVTVLRRYSTNVVDVLTGEGHYVRAFAWSRAPLVARVSQVQPNAVAVTLEGYPDEHARALALMRRMLGVDRSVAHFDRAAARIPWLGPLAARMRGVKPPRYATLWEACVNTIVSQQISLFAATSILPRLVVALGCAVGGTKVPLHTFPTVDSVLGATDGLLRATGLSGSKVAALRRVGAALASGTLDEGMLEDRASTDAATTLCQIKGIGPWTAAAILLRGLGRLDVFPTNDSSVARNLAFMGGPGPIDIEAILNALRPQQGMLYYHLLLARLEARGDVGRASSFDERA